MTEIIHLGLTTLVVLIFIFSLVYIAYRLLNFYFEKLDHRIPSTKLGNVLVVFCLVMIAVILSLFIHYYWHFIYLYCK